MIDSPLNQDKDDSSNDMIDIRIEESLVRESLMKIDASNLKDDYKLFIVYFGIIILSFILGCTGLQRYDKEIITKPIQPSSTINYKKTDLSSPNSFISFFISFSNPNTSQPIEFNVNLSYDAVCLSKGIIIHKSNEQINNLLVQSYYNYDSSLFNFYFDRIIDYDQITVNLKLITPDTHFQKVSLIVYYGDKYVNLIIICIKCIFALIHLLLLIKVIQKLKVESVRYWHLEQKLTIPLIFISIFYNNPFDLIQAFSPSYSLLIYDCIVESVFTAYFQFFILALFDSLRFKNRKIQRCFFTPKISFILTLFLISLSHRIYITITSFDTSPTLRHDGISSVFRLIELILYLLYYVWFLVSVILAGFQVDITERYKFNVYFVTCFVSLLMLAFSRFLHIFQFFENKTLILFVSIATINMFVILMLFFHYPYEVIDGRYDNNNNNENQGNDNGNKNNDQNIFTDSTAQIETIN